MREAQNTFQDTWYRDNYLFFIFSDTNRFKIRTSVLPSFITQTLGRYTYDIVIFDDDDGADKRKSLEDIIQCLKDTLTSRKFGYWKILRTGDFFSFQAIPEKDTRFLINIKVIFVPESLEILLVRKTLDKNSHIFSAPEKRSILKRTDIHDAFEKCAKKMGLTRSELINKSVQEMWFGDDDWYKEITRHLTQHKECATQQGITNTLLQ